MLLHKVQSALNFYKILLHSSMTQSKHRAHQFRVCCHWLWCDSSETKNVSFQILSGNKPQIENQICVSNTTEFQIIPQHYGNLTNCELQIFIISKLSVCACQKTSGCRCSKTHYHNPFDKSSSAHFRVPGR